VSGVQINRWNEHRLGFGVGVSLKVSKIFNLLVLDLFMYFSMEGIRYDKRLRSEYSHAELDKVDNKMGVTSIPIYSFRLAWPSTSITERTRSQLSVI
jgi:hypothetical protein